VRIQSKLFLFAICCAVIPLLATFIFSFGAVKASLTKTVAENLQAQAVEEMESLQQQLASAKHELATLSQLSTMLNVQTGDPLGNLQKDLDIFATRTPLFNEIVAVDYDGNAIAGTLQQFVGQNLSGTWEFEAPKLGIQFDGRVVRSYRHNLDIATQSVPLYDQIYRDKIVGVLIGSINWELLQRTLANRRVFGGTQNQQHQIFLQSVEDDRILYGTEGVNVPSELIKAAGAESMVKDVLLNGVEFSMVTVASKPFKEFRDPQWRLHLLLDKDIAYSTILEIQKYFIAAAVLVSMLVFGFGLLLSRNIVNPVKELVAGAESLANGNYDYDLLESETKDEIGQLTKSFNDMREAVQINEQELVNKTEIAEQAARLKGEFLANMSHEVRTPINGVLGMTELLLNTELDITQKRYASTISRSGNALLAVINDILDYSKIDAGKLELSHAAFDLRDLVEDVVEILAESAHKKGVEVNLILDPQFHMTFSGDANRLRQVLLNLMGNAVKFTNEGEVKLEVSMARDDADDALIKFAVIDTGIGVPATAQKTIFESFVQADGTNTRQFGGTGLGLAISANLARLMGGEIGLESEVGVGSTFWVTANLEKLPDTIEKAWRNPDSLSGKHILIVDDNHTNCEILESQVQYWGATTVVVNSCVDALRALESAYISNRYFDAALLDMHMPNVNGLELAGLIKSKKLAPDIRVMILSSSIDTIDRKTCAANGVNAIATKPIRQPELFNSIVAMQSSDGLSDINTKSKAKKIESNSLVGTVLLVEDNPVNQDMMLEVLRQFGVNTVLAENGQVALNAIEQQHFDLVLMDCQMPVLDGFAATRAIRKCEENLPESKRLSIVALTANAMHGDKQRCLDSGMDDYLSKPISTDLLGQMLEKYLSTSNAAPEINELATADTPHSGSVEALGSNVLTAEFTQTENSEQSVDQLIIDDKVFSQLWSMCESASPGFYRSLVDKFDDSSENDLNQIEQAIADNDAVAVGALAHKVKSGSANLGGRQLTVLCKTLETNGKDNDLSNAQRLLHDIRVARDDLLDWLRSKESKAA
jgi:signal transduction histidine kinase/CheY-like chemotaxis protein/HPt (histidine-containing phosphotransfer) domain-containing protein